MKYKAVKKNREHDTFNNWYINHLPPVKLQHDEDKTCKIPSRRGIHTSVVTCLKDSVLRTVNMLPMHVLCLYTARVSYRDTNLILLLSYTIPLELFSRYITVIL